MHLTGCSTTDEQWTSVAFFVHVLGIDHHLVERWCDQAAETDEICFDFLSLGGYLIPGNHNTEIMDLVVVTAEDNADNVLSNVMDITLNGGEDNYTSVRTFFLLHVLKEVVDGLLHDTSGLNDLRQEHLSSTKALTDDVHTSHKWTFNNLQRHWVGQP